MQHTPDDVGKIDVNRWTALHVASWTGHVQVVLTLLQASGNIVDAQDNDGWTAIYCAAEMRQYDVARVLIDFKVDTEIQTMDGYTALHIACRKGEEEVIGLLLAAQANIDLTDKYGWTPLHRAAQNG
jgi:ankyrin repeat protein